MSQKHQPKEKIETFTIPPKDGNVEITTEPTANDTIIITRDANLKPAVLLQGVWTTRDLNTALRLIYQARAQRNISIRRLSAPIDNLNAQGK